jgi:hypothetical protein
MMPALQFGPDWPNRQQEWLLQAALWKGPRAADAWRRWKEAVDIDQLDGGSQGLLPLLYHNLTEQGSNDPLLAWCKGFYRRAWYLNQLTIHHMTGVLRALHQAGIRRLLLLKGAAMALAHYGDYGLRPMSDFDFQVPLDQGPAATALLVLWGWRPKSQLPRQHGWDFTDAQGRKLDLHWYSLFDCPQPGIDDDFWASASETHLADVPVQLLCPTDQLLHICAHGARWQIGSPLRWIADAVMILRATPRDAIDWGRLVNAAQQRGVAPLLLDSLTYLRDLMEAPVPSAVLDDLTPPPPVPDRVPSRWRVRRVVGVMRKAVRRGVRLLAG